MRRFLPLFFIALLLPSQTPAQNLDKPPQDVDDALRARVKQFYDYHVAQKYRQAEQLVAEESKDDFYVMSKPEIKSYRINGIDYSDKFTKAKVVVVGNMPVLLPFAGPKVMDMPFASYWKLENGIWYWYYNKEAARETPFGHLKEQSSDTKPANPPSAAPAPPDPEKMLGMLQSALKIDRNRIDLVPGEPQTVHVTNTLPGPASLSITSPNVDMSRTGITAAFDKKDLKGNETAVLTLTADKNAQSGSVPLQIIVAPTNQVLQVTVAIRPR